MRLPSTPIHNSTELWQIGVQPVPSRQASEEHRHLLVVPSIDYALPVVAVGPQHFVPWNA